MVHGKKILLAPLDWGLGHATRCIPLIEQFLQNNCTILVAGNAKTNGLIREAFPQLKFENLPGYDVRYSRTPAFMPLSILWQIPKLLRKIRFENEWLKIKVKEFQPDLIISDNRYGFYHEHIHSVFITHQLHIQVPQSKFLSLIINRWNHSLIKKFNECWIPDREDFHLAGTLSTATVETKTKYIGWLSRFKKPEEMIEQDIDYLFLLSGPEPQRGLFEQKIMKECSSLEGRKVLIQGLPNASRSILYPEFEVYNHVQLEPLRSMILRSKHIICRSGYSTLMDLIRLRKTALLIPTPGQTEQEYLANYLSDKKLFLSIKQEQSLMDGIKLFQSSNLHSLPEE